jgi:hypothetical protein
MKEFKMDLHVHTCLSPCAEPEMTPQAIVRQAKERNLDVVAVCDHNSAENVGAVKKAGANHGVQVLGGMEICSSEEVHILAIFDNDDALFEMQTIVYDHLFGENDEKYFGSQLLVDEHDQVVGSTPRLLIGSTILGVSEIVETVHGLGGLAVASHVDREAFSIIGQLGFIPEGLPLDALEVSWRCADSDIGDYRKYGFEVLRSSDAHILQDIGRSFTTFQLEAAEFSEVAMALEGVGARQITK